MKKLDESKVRYIVREKKKGTRNAIIAERMGISIRWVQKIWKRYRYTEPSQIVYPKPMGRPKKSLPGRLEHSAVLSARQRTLLATTRLKGKIGMYNRRQHLVSHHIPHIASRETGQRGIKGVNNVNGYDMSVNIPTLYGMQIGNNYLMVGG